MLSSNDSLVCLSAYARPLARTEAHCPSFDHPPDLPPQTHPNTSRHLRIPPGNRLEALKGKLQGLHSIRVNDQYRVCFRWDGQNAHEVEITDYH